MPGRWCVGFEPGSVVTTAGETDGPELTEHALHVDSSPDHGWLRVRLNDEVREVRILRGAPDALLLVNGKVLAFGLQADGKRRQCALPAMNRNLEVTPGGARSALAGARPSSARGGAGWIEAPMPGRVVKLSVALGDVVTPGVSLLVLEAMKMQNDVFCSVHGRVTSLNVQAGDAVERGARLLQIAVEAPG